MKLYIFDTTHEDARLLVSLSVLIDALESLIPDFAEKEFEVLEAECGYGKNLCDMETRLDNNEHVIVTISELRKLLSDGQYFISVTLRDLAGDLMFGIFDSSFLFVESKNAELIANIATKFRKTEIR